MSDTLLQSLEHMPYLVFALALTGMFLRYQMTMARDNREAAAEAAAETLATLRQLSADNIEARRHSQRVIEASTAAAARQTVALESMTSAFREMAARAA